VTLEDSVVEVPFELRDTFPVPLVEVQIGDRGPYRFAVDTAAACTVLLRRSLADELGLERVGTAGVADASGRPSRPAETVRLPELRFGGVVARDLVAISHAPSAAHAASIPDDTDGILGRVLFESLLLTLDYPRRRLVLSEDRLEAGPASTPFELVQDVMQLNVDVAGRSVPVFLDSGHRGTLTLPRSWADLLPLGGPLVDAGQTATVNATYTRQTAPLTGALVVAGARVESPLLYFADEHTPRLLGGGLLREFAITIDQRSRLVRFERGEQGKRKDPASL
jgi:predicted aspartyl protease